MAANTSFTLGQVSTSTEANNFPFGVVGLQTLTTAFGTAAPNTTFQDTGMTLTITEISGRRYRITAKINIYPGGGLQGIFFQCLRGATVLNRVDFPSAAVEVVTTFSTLLSFVYISTGSGSATYKMQMAAQTNNTQVNDHGSATYLRQFSIEDIGRA